MRIRKEVEINGVTPYTKRYIHKERERRRREKNMLLRSSMNRIRQRSIVDRISSVESALRGNRYGRRRWFSAASVESEIEGDVPSHPMENVWKQRRAVHQLLSCESKERASEIAKELLESDTPLSDENADRSIRT